MTDMVNSPPHYGIGDTGLEACDVVRPLMTKQEWEKHCLATALYYLLRLGRKDDPAQDAAKAIWWLTWIAKGDPRATPATPASPAPSASSADAPSGSPARSA